MRYRILPYKAGSRSAKALADALGGKVLRLEGSTFTSQPNDVVISWGGASASASPYLGLCKTFNGGSTSQATNKLSFFNLMAEANQDVIPKFWVNREDIPTSAYPVVCRTLLSAHSGAGIVIAYSAAGLVDAPLYTQYLKKKDEYRIHVGLTDEGPCLISVQKKARRLDCPSPNWQVRNHQNGFVYKREGVQPPSCVIQAAYKAFDVSGLDFGACDLIYNEQKDRAWCLEINTAPGLEGQTVEDYATFFRSLT